MESKQLYFFFLFCLILITFAFFNHSSFTNVRYNCKDPLNDSSKESRQFPSGHVPGSYLILTEAEKSELLHRFVENEGT